MNQLTYAMCTYVIMHECTFLYICAYIQIRKYVTTTKHLPFKSLSQQHQFMKLIMCLVFTLVPRHDQMTEHMGSVRVMLAGWYTLLQQNWNERDMFIKLIFERDLQMVKCLITDATWVTFRLRGDGVKYQWNFVSSLKEFFCISVIAGWAQSP